MEKIRKSCSAENLWRLALRVHDPELNKEIHKRKIEGLNVGSDLVTIYFALCLIQVIYVFHTEV